MNIEIPDDARELDRDVLAYHRELRARRRRQRMRRLVAPFAGRGGPLPLIAACVALSMLAGAMLSIFAISPASAPTRPPAIRPAPSASSPPGAASTAPPPGAAVSARRLPAGLVLVNGHSEPLPSLAPSVLALVPPGCACGAALREVASQAAAAHVQAFFVATGTVIPQLSGLIAQYGNGTARPLTDTANLLGTAYRPAGLTVLLVHSDAIAVAQRNLQPGFRLGPLIGELYKPYTR